jgi:two-component system sensor histidine kinase TctE
VTTPASLRRALLVRLGVPLVAVMLLAAASSYGLAQYYSQHVLDQWLYDSAVTLAKQVRVVAGRAELDIPGRAIEMFELDVTDRVYYEVNSAKQGRIFSNATLPAPREMPETGTPLYYDGAVEGQPVRVIAIAVEGSEGDPVLVKVAETRRKRDMLARSILLSTLLLLAALVLTALVLIWLGIGGGLESLERIVREVRSRPGSLLAPIPRSPDVPKEVHPLIDAINDLLAELGEEHAGRQRFIADAAHQLRTPLASLKVQLDLALREQDPERHQKALANALGVLSRTSHLISRLLALARADQAGDNDPLAPVDLQALAREEVEAWVDRAIDRRVDLGYDGPAGPVMVEGRAVLLREAVSNLIDNAIAYGGSPGRVTVSVREHPPEVAVEDEGPGIAPSERERVLDRFYRTPGTRGEGAGLGLAIVEEIARRHRAQVAIEDRAGGRGVRIVLRFPPRGETAAK